MRFIENDCLRAGQELDEAFLLHGEIGEQQVMVDDDEIRLLGGAACIHDVTFLVCRTFGTETVICRGRNKWPDGRVFCDFRQLGAIAGRCSMPPFANDFQIRGL